MEIGLSAGRGLCWYVFLYSYIHMYVCMFQDVDDIYMG